MRHRPDAASAEVCDTDPDVPDSKGLDAYLGRVAELRAWCDARQVHATRAQRRLAAEGRAADPQRQGVDAFTRGCRDLATSIRARHDARSDVDDLEAQHAQSKISRWVDQTTGMHHTHIGDPHTDRQTWSAVQQARSRLRRRNQQTGNKPTRDRLTVDALVDAVTSSGGPPARTGMVVHIDLSTLTGGHHDITLCETESGVPLPVDTVRRMACDADIILIVSNGDGVVLDEGRTKRLVTHQQRLAIEAVQATCSHPDCAVAIDDCRIHHLTPWAAGGRTDLADMAPVCEPHHHLIHEGGWTLTMTPDRTATWTRPDGQHCWTGNLIDRKPIAA